MRWIMSVTSIMAPSAVANIDMASCALRTAWVNPLIWEVIFEEIARPAASSAAELILSPVASRSIAWFIARSFFMRAWLATVALILVFMLTIFVFRQYPPR